MPLRDDVLGQLDRLIKQGQRYVSVRDKNNFLAAEQWELGAFRASVGAAVERIAGSDSEFYRSLPPLPPDGYLRDSMIEATYGTALALRDAVQHGELERLESRIRANVEDDFLDQGATLLASGYHVAAMVLVGGVLEDRLRVLLAKGGLTVAGARSLSKYNDALVKAGVYDQPTWRRIQAITDLRNHAAHGGDEAAKVKPEDVEDALKYVRRFLGDYPG